MKYVACVVAAVMVAIMTWRARKLGAGIYHNNAPGGYSGISMHSLRAFGILGCSSSSSSMLLFVNNGNRCKLYVSSSVASKSHHL